MASSAERKPRALILGVSSRNSIGGAAALALVAAGWEVAVSCRPGKVELVSALLQAEGITRVLGIDALEPETLDVALAALSEEWGVLDAMVHCFAGCPNAVLAKPLTELGELDFSQVLSIGSYSLIRACRGAAQMLSASDSPRVVTLLSESDRRVTPNYHVLGIAKAALRSAMIYLAHELGPRGVLVNAVSFSLIATEGACRTVGEGAAEATRRHLAKKSPTPASLEVEDVVRAITYFAAQCRNTTGQVLTVDGGYAQLYF